MDAGIEPAGRSLAGGERERDHVREVGGDFERARTVQLRQLGVGAEARHDLLEAFELGLDRVEGLGHATVRGANEQLDVRPHRAEGVRFDHDVLVITSGGNVTTRGAGAGAATGC